MRKKFNRKILAAALSAVVVCSAAVSAADPGTQSDPLISKSYVDSSIIPYVDKVSTFTVLNMTAGQTLIGEAGCEVILRMGSATVIATAKGGLCDTTIGGDWPSGSPVPSNHDLIVPLSDGRGIKAVSDIIILVKGEYSIS